MSFLNESVVAAAKEVVLIVVGLGIVAVLYLAIVALIKSDNSNG